MIPLYRRVASTLIVFPGIIVIPVAIGWFFGMAIDYDVQSYVRGSYAVACLTGGIAFGVMVGWFSGRLTRENKLP